jgi:hypothetical protein
MKDKYFREDIRLGGSVTGIEEGRPCRRCGQGMDVGEKRWVGCVEGVSLQFIIALLVILVEFFAGR